jgi:hypothetical protein
MSILDKLAERKDILSYIDFRIEILKCNIREVKKMPKSDRQKAVMKLTGRIRELESMREVINRHEEKKLSKKYWKEIKCQN